MKINTTQFINLWNNINSPYGLYIHSPFCTNTCTFCAYRGIANQATETINQYYQNLLKYLDLFMPYIQQHNPEVIYFGGGTPNLFPTDVLQEVFNRFQGMTETNIAVELSPSDSLDGLDIWAKNSDLIILGVQSFDLNTLQTIKRKHVPFEKVKEIVNTIKGLGCHCAIDLVADLYPTDTWERFLEDFSLAKTLDVDFICIADNYNQRLNQDKMYKLALGHSKVAVLDKNARSYIINFTDYNPQNEIFRKYYYTPERMDHSVLGIGAVAHQTHPTMSTLLIDNHRFDVQQLDWDSLQVYQLALNKVNKDFLNYSKPIQNLLKDGEINNINKGV